MTAEPGTEVWVILGTGMEFFGLYSTKERAEEARDLMKLDARFETAQLEKVDENWQYAISHPEVYA